MLAILSGAPSLPSRKAVGEESKDMVCCSVAATMPEESGLLPMPGGLSPVSTAQPKPAQMPLQVRPRPEGDVETATDRAGGAGAVVEERSPSPGENVTYGPAYGGVERGGSRRPVGNTPADDATQEGVSSPSSSLRAAVPPVNMRQAGAGLNVDSRALRSATDPIDYREGAESSGRAPRSYSDSVTEEGGPSR